jgi:hypothetical protein
MAIPKNGHSSHPRRDLLEHLQPFAAQAVFEHQESGGIAARARQARNEPVPTGSTTTTNTIGMERVACSNGREGRSARTSQDCIRCKCGQFDHVLANVVGIGRGPAGVHPQVAAVGPPQRRQSLVKRPDAGLIFRIVGGRGHEDTMRRTRSACWARAANGHAAAAPPNAASNSCRPW